MDPTIYGLEEESLFNRIFDVHVFWCERLLEAFSS